MFFSVNTEIDRKCLRETFWFFTKEGKVRCQVKMSIIGVVSYFMMSVGLLLLTETPVYPYLFISLAISVLLTALTVFVLTPMQYSRINIKSIKKAYGTTVMHFTFRFYEDRIERDSKEKQDTKVTFYDSITSYKETKRYILLEVAQDNYVYTIDKYGFTKGTTEEFIPFIQSKIHTCSK